MPFATAFKTFPVLETSRLILRELTAQDAEAYHREQRSAMDLPGRPHWAYGFETESVANAARSIGFAHNAWKKKARIKWGIGLKAEGNAIIGQVELMDFANQSKAEIGYWLGASHHNQGLMTEALAAVVQYAFETMDMHRIYAKTDTENAPSMAMLGKAGFVQEGVLRQETARDGAWCDTAIMAILKSDFSRPRTSK